MDRSMLRLIPSLLLASLVACAGPATAPTGTPSSSAPPATVVPTDVPPTSTSAPTEAPALSFEPLTYTDEEAGFSLQYPAGWTLDGRDPSQQGARGYYVQLTSWQHAPGDIGPDLPEGGTVLSVTVQLWDPTHDLEAFVAQRKQAWDASGFTILSEETRTLSSGQQAQRFTVQTPEDERAYFLFTTLSDRYLVLSGAGDLELLAEIGTTLAVEAPDA